MEGNDDKKKRVTDLPPSYNKRGNEIVPGPDPSNRSPLSRLLSFFGK